MRVSWLVVFFSVSAVAQPMVLEGALPESGPDFVLVPFQVPMGTVEVEVRHPVQQPENILDYGLSDPRGLRGWGGGNVEPIVVGERAASRSYLARPVEAGTWNVVIGKAKVVSAPARYRLEVELRTVATLSPQAERAQTTWTPGAALEPTPRWYAGDLHVHSRESGDATPTLDAIATFARSRGLDFVELSDHNTVSQLDFMTAAQARHPALLFLPGVEFTTYAGHLNGIGATRIVDHRFGLEGATFDAAVAAFGEQKAVLSINHPVLDLGQLCIGCAWRQKLPATSVGAVEIGTGGWDKTGALFGTQALAFWDRQLSQGSHAAAVGGSDDHSGGRATGTFDSPIGNPTTMVFAKSLSVDAIVQAIREGRTVVKLQGPADPMVELTVGDARIGDTVRSAQSTLQVKVTGGRGQTLKLLENGAVKETAEVTDDPFLVTRLVTAPGSGEVRWRGEVWVDGAPRTVSSHLWFAPPEPMKPGCGCSGLDPMPVVVLAALLLRLRR